MVTVKTNLEITQKQSVSTATLTWAHRQDSHTGPEQRKTSVNENTSQIRSQAITVYKTAKYLINLQALLGPITYLQNTHHLCERNKNPTQFPAVCIIHEFVLRASLVLPTMVSTQQYTGFQPEHLAVWGTHQETWKPWKFEPLGSLTCAGDRTCLWSIGCTIARGDLSQQLCDKLNTSSCYASITTFLHLRKKHLYLFVSATAQCFP